MVVRFYKKKEADAYRNLFFLGLHGPDLFFYYHPLYSNPVTRLGFGMHEKPGIVFFKHAGKVICDHCFSPEYITYIYGFICHFALDRACHGYVNEKIAQSGVSHVEIEAEFDRMLLEKDGFDPVSKKLTDHIHPSEREGGVISSFFPKITPKRVYQSMRSMVFYCDLLCAPGKIKRSFLNAALKAIGKEEICGMIINRKANPKCADSCEKLLVLYEKAIDDAVKLITSYLLSVQKKQSFDSLYHYTFESTLPQGERKRGGMR